MSGSRDIFNKLTNEAEREQLFKDLVRTSSEILCKGPDSKDGTFILRALNFSFNELECEVLNSTQPFLKTGELILQMSLELEKYLCMAPFHVRGGKFFIKANVDVFHLQRRDDFRLRLPSSFTATFKVRSLNGKMAAANFAISDLSGGGCRLVNEQSHCTLTVDDMISGELQFPDRPPIEVLGQVRHERTDENQKTKYVGVQFENLSDLVKNRIVALVMDLYREHFSRWSKQ